MFSGEWADAAVCQRSRHHGERFGSDCYIVILSVEFENFLDMVAQIQGSAKTLIF